MLLTLDWAITLMKLLARKVMWQLALPVAVLSSFHDE